MEKSPQKQDYSASIRELVVPPGCAGLRLDQTLAQLLPEHSRSRLAQWVRDGRVMLDGHEASPRDKVWGGEALRVHAAADPRAVPAEAQAIPLDIVYEDAALLVINKPSGLVVHPGSGNWDGTLLNALLAHEPLLSALPRAGIVHRLDKDTSGLLVVARTLESQTNLVRQLQARSVTRIYAALAHGIVERAGTVEAPIGRHPVSRTRMAVVARGKPAVTHYTPLARFSDATLLECRLETGRTHQIRVHLASIAHPLVGDPVYGKRTVRSALAFHRQALHAKRLGLTHPLTGERMTWEAPIPDDMRALIATLQQP
jgi:23S rRNA pseudouridine1911/1915/1917 synthase